MDHDNYKVASLRAFIEWSAYHHFSSLLAPAVEEYVKLVENGVLDSVVMDLLHINTTHGIVEVIDYSNDEEDEEDPFDALLQSLTNLEASHKDALPASRWAKSKRLCVVQKVLRFISLSWLDGEVPSRAEDIDVPAKHNYFATVEAVKQIFQTNKQVYVQYKHADPLSGEKFEHDMDSLSMGIVKVHNQNTFKVQKLKLFDQFEAHKLDDFKQNITALLDDLLKALYPCPIALQCTYAPEKKVQSSRSKVTDVVDSVAHDQDWNEADGPYVSSAKKSTSAKKASSSKASTKTLESAEPFVSPSEAVASSNEVRKNLHNTIHSFQKKYAACDPLPSSIETGKQTTKSVPLAMKRSANAAKIDFDEELPGTKRTRSSSSAAKQTVKSEESEDIDDSDESDEENRAQSTGLQRLKKTAQELEGRSANRFPTSLTSSGSGKKTKPNKSGTKRVPWSAEEEDALRGAIQLYGYGNWALMLEDEEFGAILKDRTNVNLKDKCRTMRAAGAFVEAAQAAEPVADENA